MSDVPAPPTRPRRRRSLGAQLALLVALSTVLGVVAFVGVVGIVEWVDELPKPKKADKPDKPPKPGKPPKPDRPDKPRSAWPDVGKVAEEVADDVGLAILIATPFAVLVALGVARAASRRVTRRIDGLIAAAAEITADDLGRRLPLSGRGDELDDLAAALNRVFVRIDDGVAALRRFAADVSHELRTPLAVLVSDLEVHRRRPREVAAWEALADRQLDELRGLAELVEALLHGARAGAFDLSAEPVELDRALDAICERFRAAGDAAGVAVEVDAASGATVRVDPRGLAIAIGNLVRNAIGHAPRGTAVTLRTRREGDRALVEVDDRGPGVPADERARILEPFVRGASAAATTDSGGARAGVGLGLSIAQRIVAAHGGSLTVGDAPGGGARFTVALPTA